MAYDVFISHSTTDKAVADAVCAALENAGIRCWIAPRDVQPGRSFAGEIARAIKKSKAMVLIFSAHSNNSEQVLREVQLAVTAHLHIVQFRIEDVRLNDDLSYFLSTPHWLDALTPPLENHIERLETSIRTLLGTPVEPSVMVVAKTESQTTTYPRRLWRSTAAVLIGFFVYVVFSAGTDQIMRMLKVSSPWGVVMWVAGRCVCALAAGHIAARFAPRNPMRHVWVLGFIGLGLVVGGTSVVALSGATSGRDYLIALAIALAGGGTLLLCVWLGGVLHRRCHSGSPHSSSEEGDVPGRVPRKAEASTVGEVRYPPVKRGRSFALAGAIIALLAAVVFGGWWFGVEQPRRAAERQRLLTELNVPQPPWVYENSLGMKFVYARETGVFVSIWTRVKDYKLFVEATKREWDKPGFQQTEEDPVVNVSWDDATAFCEWLTEKERKAGLIWKSQGYHLPTDREWSVALDKWASGSGALTEELLKVQMIPGGENLWQWCQDWNEFDTKLRVLRRPERGSSYVTPERRDVTYGFRCVFKNAALR